MAQAASDKGGHTKEAVKWELLNYEAYQCHYFTSGCAPSFFARHDLQRSFVVPLIAAEVGAFLCRYPSVHVMDQQHGLCGAEFVKVCCTVEFRAT